jgi:hypothetical protein
LKVVSLCGVGKELESLQRKVDVVTFNIRGIKRKNVERGRLRESYDGGHNECEDCGNETDALDHRCATHKSEL